MQIPARRVTVATMITPPQCLYITDLVRTGKQRLLQVVREGCAAGIDGVLLREPTLDSGKLLALAAELRVITREQRARLIIHSQADIARAVAADGVHLSAAMIDEAAAIRRWLGAAQITLSTSCHNREELEQSHAGGADFALLSPLFATASHPETAPLGIARFRQLAARSPLPVVALGGITTANRMQVAGYPIAAMRAIDEAGDIAAAVAQLLGEQPAMAQQ